MHRVDPEPVKSVFDRHTVHGNVEKLTTPGEMDNWLFLVAFATLH